MGPFSFSTNHNSLFQVPCERWTPLTLCPGLPIPYLESQFKWGHNLNFRIYAIFSFDWENVMYLYHGTVLLIRHATVFLSFCRDNIQCKLCRLFANFWVLLMKFLYKKQAGGVSVLPWWRFNWKIMLRISGSENVQNYAIKIPTIVKYSRADARVNKKQENI